MLKKYFNFQSWKKAAKERGWTIGAAYPLVGDRKITHRYSTFQGRINGEFTHNGQYSRGYLTTHLDEK